MAGPRGSGSGAVPLASQAVIQEELRRALSSGSRNPAGTVLLLRAAPEWRDAARFDVRVPAGLAPDGIVPVIVAACPTALALLDALAAPREPGCYLVVLTPVEDVGSSVLARGVVPEVRPVRRWDLVAGAFGARIIDPMLTDGADGRGVAYPDWVPEALLDAAPPGGWPRLAGPVLTHATALNRLAAARLGVRPGPGDSGVDAAALLEWTADPASVTGFLALREAERDGIIEWVTRETAGRAAGVVFAMDAARIPDAVPFGLAAAALYRHGDALVARVRAEERFLARPEAMLALGGEDQAAAMLALGEAAEALVTRWARGGRAAEAAAMCERAERILRELGGGAAAGESRVLGAGLDARLAALAAALQQALASGRPAPAALAAAEAALDQVTGHRRTEGRQAEVGGATAAVRLARWLSAGEAPPGAPAAGAVSMLRSWAWADRCLEAAGQAGASRVPGLAAACRAIADRARARRAGLDEALARTIAGLPGAAGAGGLLTAGSLLEDIAMPVARQRPPVLVVLDGASAAGGIEIAEEIASGGWWTEAGRRDDGREPALAGEGWVPEPAGFTASWGRRKSRVLCTADLIPAPGRPLSGQAVTAIAEPDTVVAAVLSAAGGSTPRAVDDVACLRAVLSEARRAGRPVILTCAPGPGEAGHHGQAPPAWAVVPVITLLPAAALLPPGWHAYDAGGHAPAWWHAPAARFPAADSALDATLLPGADEDGSPAAGATLGALVAASPRMAAQRRIVRHGPGDASITALIDALARAGGRLTITEAAAAAGVPAVRMSGYMAQATRLLNADSYPVLSLRDRGTIVSLSEQLLRQEFLGGDGRRHRPAHRQARRRQPGTGTPPRRLRRHPRRKAQVSSVPCRRGRGPAAAAGRRAGAGAAWDPRAARRSGGRGPVAYAGGMAGTRRADAAPQATTAEQPGVAELRVIGPPAVVDAARALLAEALGTAWQPGTRKKSRHGDGQELLYGTLIVAMGTDPEASQRP